MARPNKEGLDYFPLWKPQNITENKFHSPDFKVRYKALRNSSSSFINRKDVREIILRDCKGRCIICGSNINLQVHHIVSVYFCAKGVIGISELNIRKNLTILCEKCNSSKSPNEKEI